MSDYQRTWQQGSFLNKNDTTDLFPLEILIFLFIIEHLQWKITMSSDSTKEPYLVNTSTH